MRIFVFAPESNGTLQLVKRLQLRGYTAEHASPAHFVPVTDHAALRKQMRDRIMRLITWCDAVAVPADAITAEELSRLLVVCEFAGKRLVPYEDLPAEAPEDGHLPNILTIGTRVCMVQNEAPVTVHHASARISKLLEHASAFFNHGRWLKNPMVSGRA